jgi:hypothetical protein
VDDNTPHAVRYCVDEITDRFRLYEIDLPVQDCSSCELSWFCVPSTDTEQRSHERVRDGNSTVNGEFDGIIPRVGSWRRERNDDRSVYQRSVGRISDPA